MIKKLNCNIVAILSNHNKILQRFISFLLICIFAFSITPVIVLHNLFADHSDIVINHNHIKSNEVAKAGINCHIESFVAERNFIASYTPLHLSYPANYSEFFSRYVLAFYSQHHFFAELRGPPAKA